MKIAILCAAAVSVSGLWVGFQRSPGSPAQTPPAATRPAVPASRPAAPAASRPATQPANLSETGIDYNASGKPMSSGPVQKGPLLIDPLVVDFGLVAPLTKVKGKSILTNTSDKPVVIKDAQTTCQCTSIVDIKGKVIAPGESIPLEIALDTPPSPLIKAAAVQMVISDFNELISVKVQCEVTLAIRAIPPFIDVQQNPVPKQDPLTFKPQPLTGSLELASIDGKPFRILASLHKELRIDGFDAEKDAARNSYTLKYDFHGTPCELMPKYLILETDRAECPAMDIRLRHECAQIAPAFAIDGFVRGVGKIAPGGSGEFEIVIKNFAPNTISGLQSMSADAKAELLSAKSDGRHVTCKVRITPRKGLTGLFSVPVVFSNGSLTAELIVYGLVR